MYRYVSREFKPPERHTNVSSLWQATNEDGRGESGMKRKS